MPYKNLDIVKILPSNEVHWKLKFCPKPRIENNEYRISIEVENNKRQYTCLSFEDLVELVTKLPLTKRCFYEHISRDDRVKCFLDYEYYKDVRNSMINVGKALFSIQRLFIDLIKIISDNEDILMNDFILLQSSSDEKESYHIVLNNDYIRFNNNKSLYDFIAEVLRSILLITLQHKCLRNKNSINLNFNDEDNFEEVFNKFQSVWLDRFTCVNCKLDKIEIYVCDVCNLFAYDKKGSIVSCIDLKVYGVEQDFRVFMCTKYGEERPLKKCLLSVENQIEQDENLISSESI